MLQMSANNYNLANYKLIMQSTCSGQFLRIFYYNAEI
mgnify:CR=1 FL=1